MLVDPISIAVWYMDDGYLYHRDRMVYIYVPHITNKEISILLSVLKENFGLKPSVKVKKKGNIALVFSVKETRRLLSLVSPYIIPSFQYKLLDPVSTEH